MALFKRRHHVQPLKARMRKGADTALRCFLLFLGPTAISILVSFCWYFFLYRHDRNLGDGTQELIATALLPALGILYGIMLAGVAVGTVWAEYKSMRTAVKRYDLDTFMDLRDEELSPLIHMIIGTVSFGMLFGFLALKYPSAESGIIMIFSVTFFLALMYFVIKEIDDPCSGLWFIKGIPSEWLDINPKDYRNERCRKSREDFLKKKNGTGNGAKASAHAGSVVRHHRT